ncbi:hypothetical protein D3C85_1533660 [compost metagenome]
MRLDHLDIQQADVVSRAPAKTLQRLQDFFEQQRRPTVGTQNLTQAFDAKQLLVVVTGIDHAIGQQKQALAQGQGQHFGSVVEALRRQDSQGQVTRNQWHGFAATGRQQITVGHPTIPNLYHPPLKAQVE